MGTRFRYPGLNTSIFLQRATDETDKYFYRTHDEPRNSTRLKYFFLVSENNQIVDSQCLVLSSLYMKHRQPNDPFNRPRPPLCSSLNR